MCMYVCMRVRDAGRHERGRQRAARTAELRFHRLDGAVLKLLEGQLRLWWDLSDAREEAAGGARAVRERLVAHMQRLMALLLRHI